MRIINGFTCHDCTEEDRAKKGIDPAHPENGPQLARRDLKKDEGAPELGVNAPQRAGSVGTKLDLWA